MRRLVSILVMTVIFSSVSYAGEWKRDEMGWQYYNDDGTCAIGWHQDVDGKWYYFDEHTTYMLSNTVTPDGYKVLPSGEWDNTERGGLNLNNNYDNKVEVVVTSYDSLPEPEPLGYPLPVTVYYNNEYDNLYGGKIKISKIELSKEGLLYLVFSLSENSGHYKLDVMYKYNFSDGTYQERKDDLINVSVNVQDNISALLLSRLYSMRRMEPTSVDVYINAGTVG